MTRPVLYFDVGSPFAYLAAARGVFGVPTVAVGAELFWGDDRLEEAARAGR